MIVSTIFLLYMCSSAVYGQVCEMGVPMGDCNGQTPCPQYHVCIQNVCCPERCQNFTADCNDNFPCPPTHVCIANVCCPKEGGCPEDLKTCPDGTTLNRDPPDCNFPDCPRVHCPQDAKICPDGTSLNRVPPECNFPDCPRVCEFGEPMGGCNDENPCPVYHVCLNNVCCPEPCENPISDCNDQTPCETGYVCVANVCCPEGGCPEDLKICPDGTSLSRVPPECNFPDCPRGDCPDDVLICPDGSVMIRLPPSCEFPLCRSDYFELLCEFEEHLKKDFYKFMNDHKDLVGSTDSPGSSTTRMLLDGIWDDIKCINELLCEVLEVKEQILAGEIDIFDTPMADQLWAWIELILQKSENIDLAVIKLKKIFDRKDQQVLLDDLSFLRASCLQLAITIPLRLAYDTGHMVMYIDIVGPGGINPDGTMLEICLKVEEIGNLYHKLLNHYNWIWYLIYGTYESNNQLKILPSTWFLNLAKCIKAIENLYYTLRECCRNEREYTIAELSKKLGDLLSRAMEIRQMFKNCFPAKKPGRVIGNEMKARGNFSDSDVGIVERDINDRHKGILAWVDECIIKLRCIYIDWLALWWLN